MTPPAILTVKHLGFDSTSQQLITDQSFTLQPGVTLLRGDQGTGKTLLLRLVAGELAATRGTLQIHNTLLTGAPEAYRRQVFWIDPRSAAFEALDPVTPVAYLQSVSRLYPQFEPTVAFSLTDDFALREHMAKPFYMLSTGTKRKVLLTAAFACGAAVTLLDEPFAALDKASSSCVMSRFDEAARQGRRAWLVAHQGPVCSKPLAGVIDLDAWQKGQ